MGRLADGVPGLAGDRAAGRREGAHHGAAAPRAQVPRAVRLRASAVRRAQHDQRQPARPAGRGPREDHGRGPAGRAPRLGRRQDHRHPLGRGPAHHRPRVRGPVRVLEQHPLKYNNNKYFNSNNITRARKYKELKKAKYARQQFQNMN